jgi:hypothetical protein
MLNELGALLKYEFRFYFRFLPLLYLALVLVALIARFQVNFSGLERPIMLFILYFIWIILIGVMSVITLVCIIQRFINNLMKDQGAIMLTLPVSVWTLVASKAIAALCMELMSVASVFISVLFFTKEIEEWMTLYMTQVVNIPVPNSGEIMLIAFIVCVSILKTTCLIYMAIVVSHLLPRFRFAIGCGVYLAVTIFLEQRVFNFANKNLNVDVNQYSESAVGIAFGNDFYLTLIPVGIASLAFTALYFLVAGFLLQRTFNLD